MSGDNIYSSNPTSDKRDWIYTNSNWFVYFLAGTYTITLSWLKQSTERNSAVGIFTKNATILLPKNINNLNSYNYTFTLEQDTLIGVMLKIYDGIANIQIEQGSSSTTFETYIEPQIFIKNSNDVYEEFTSNRIKELTFTKNEANNIYYYNIYATENEVQITADVRYSFAKNTRIKVLTIEKGYEALLSSTDGSARFPISTDSEVGVAGYADVNNKGEVYITTLGTAKAAYINIRYRYK